MTSMRFGTAGHGLDHAVLVGAQLVEIDVRLGEGHADVAHVRRLVHDVRHVQQRLGRDAADVQADAAQGRVLLDQHGVQP
jgi:hypothetical protein